MIIENSVTNNNNICIKLYRNVAKLGKIVLRTLTGMAKGSANIFSANFEGFQSVDTVRRGMITSIAQFCLIYIYL